MNDEPRQSDEDRDLEERLRRFRGVEPPASVWEAIEERTEPWRLCLWRRVALAAAALLIVALTVAFIIYRQPAQESQEPEIARTQPAPVVIAAGGWDKSSFELSLVRLHTMTDNPGELLNYLDARSRPLRTNGETVTLSSLLNGA